MQGTDRALRPFIDVEIAQQLEYLTAQEMRRFAQTACAIDEDSRAQWRTIGSGVAAYLGPRSPMNLATGLGLDGAVEADAVDMLTGFFADHDTRASVSVCPLADPSLLRRLGEAGYRADGFENVLVAQIDDGAAEGIAPTHACEIEIREALTDEDRELWALVAATGFSAPLPPLEEQMRLASVVVSRPGVRLLLAFMDGKAAGTGELSIADGVAWLSADTTLPQFRRMGVQRALQLHRLELGREAGCKLAVSEAQPGSTSQRNMERAGFALAYTRLDMIGPPIE